MSSIWGAADTTALAWVRGEKTLLRGEERERAGTRRGAASGYASRRVYYILYNNAIMYNRLLSSSEYSTVSGYHQCIEGSPIPVHD